MKYGSYGSSKVTFAQAPIKRGKKPSERKRDLAKLKKMFPNILQGEIEAVYNENNENIEDSILNLSSFAADVKAVESESLLVDEKSENSSRKANNLALLHDMFEDKDQEYIDKVFSQCNEDVSKTTAFIIESVEENEDDLSSGFGSDFIGFVNKQALDRRCNQNFEEMVVEMFPNVSRDDVIRVFNQCNKNFVLTIDVLGHTNESIEFEKPNPPPKKYDEEYPDMIKAPRSKLLVDGYWSKDRNNHFLEGNNVDAVKKIKILKQSFPAVDDIIIKETFFQLGDSLTATLDHLKELFPSNYRETQAEGPIFIPHPVRPSSQKPSPAELLPLVTDSRLPDQHFEDLVATMQREKQSHDTIFQIAANTAAGGNLTEAKKLSDEGKKHQKRFREIYLKVFREIFRRNNPDVENSDKIDLHGLQIEEALAMLDSFLNHVKGSFKKVEVVTGRGSHSVRGISKLKPAVSDFLSQGGFKFNELDGGYLVTLP